MVLDDNNLSLQVLGCLVKRPILLAEYDDIIPADFPTRWTRIVFSAIQNLYTRGATTITLSEVELEIQQKEMAFNEYQRNRGPELMKDAVFLANEDNFPQVYDRFKKYALLFELYNKGYDVSYYYKVDFQTPKEESEAIDRIDNSTIEDILNHVEGDYNKIRERFLNGRHQNGDASKGLVSLIEGLQQSPEFGPALEGDIFSACCRGARPGKMYLRSGRSNIGKSRLMFFDACRLCYPIRYSHAYENFVVDEVGGARRKPRKTLIITTEMGKDEVQTVILAYLSGVNEEHILTGKYEFGEKERINFAIKIMEYYHEYMFLEEIPDPNLNNVSSLIRRYATVEGIDVCVMDYIFISASLMAQFSKNVREDSVLLMMATQLKQLAKDYNIFLLTASQVNADGMRNEGFKDETCLRGAKSIADKIDLGSIISLVDDKEYEAMSPLLRAALARNVVAPAASEKPTHVIDIYKNRRGRYKNVRIWCKIDLGTGERKDLFLTRANNEPIQSSTFAVYETVETCICKNWKEGIVEEPLDNKKEEQVVAE